jgi:hypothetical protein
MERSMFELLGKHDLPGRDCLDRALFTGPMKSICLSQYDRNTKCTNQLVLRSIIEQKPVRSIDAVSIRAHHQAHIAGRSDKPGSFVVLRISDS